LSAIFGLIRLDGSRLGRDALEAMRAALAGWGGDGGGIWTAGSVGLGQQLRAVTPEDLAEDQPVASRDGRRVLVSDGRVDNRPELAAELGLPPSARRLPDSAFILAAHERWGADCGRHLSGSFSFAVWDASHGRLLVARSPFGARQVLYHQGVDFVAFAPAPRALFAVPGIPRGLCLESVADWLALVPIAPGMSLYRSIRSLEPGHALTVDSRGCRTTEFWRPAPARTLRLGSDQEYVEAFTERFDRAVADSLRSLRPVGVLMSGGLDSTSVAATAAPTLARRGERLAAFTGAPRRGFRRPGAPDSLIDEVPLASLVAERYPSIDLSVIRADGQLFLDGLDRFFDAVELPFEATVNRVWYEASLAAAQQQGIGVVLTGKCGNWTASWHGGGLIRSLTGTGRWGTAWREVQASAPVSRASSVAAALARAGVLARLPWRVQVAIAQLRNGGDPLLAADEWWVPLSPIHPQFARAQDVAGRSRARGCDHWQRRRVDTRAARWERLLSLQRDTGVSDGYSALFGVDIRDPTGDVRVAEFCLSLPEDQFRRAGVPRWLIRRAMAGRLPAEVLAPRPRAVQGADWFERLRGARGRVAEELAVLEKSEIAAATLDLPRMRRLADRLDEPPRGQPSPDPAQLRLDYSLVLQRGLMMGRFLRWFEGSGDT
jgi:asparagine synthase (glutamine-hydrolysing)